MCVLGNKNRQVTPRMIVFDSDFWDKRTKMSKGSPFNGLVDLNSHVDAVMDVKGPPVFCERVKTTL